MEKALCSTLSDPLGARSNDKASQGITMIIDKGLGLGSFVDLIETAGDYINFVKLGFGTTALYPEHVLHSKIGMAKNANIDIYPGGTFFEVAYHHNKVESYFDIMQNLGVNKVEISDGTIEIPAAQRKKVIKMAKQIGFDVITEYGKKVAGSSISLCDLIKTVEEDLEAGASYVIVEGRESGEDVGIYNSNGQIKDDFMLIAQSMQPHQKFIIWEAPKKSQQVELINWFGPNVHLGNIAPDEIFSVESLRRGLRSDTFFLDQGGV